MPQGIKCMHKSRVLLFIFALLCRDALAQCPVAGFQAPAAVCVNDPFGISDTSSGAVSWQYNFCPGDMDTAASIINQLSPGALSTPNQVKIVQDGGMYYAFISNITTGHVTRLDFGPTLSNPSPSTFTYTGFSTPYCVDVVRDDTTWYAIVGEFRNPPSNPSRLVRVDMGTAISNNSYSLTSLGNLGISGPLNIRIAKDAGDYHVFVTSLLNASLDKISFGNSLGNAPADSSYLTDPSFAQTYGFDLLYDCGLGKWVGYMSNFNPGGPICAIDFGGTLTNPGTVTHTIAAGGTPAGIRLLRDGANYHLLYTTNTPGVLQQVILGTDPLNPAPVNGYVSCLNVPACPGKRGLYFIADSSRFIGLVTSNNSTLTALKFEKSCDASLVFSTDTNPQNITYAVPGAYPVVQTITDAQGQSNSFIDTISVVNPPTAYFIPGPACGGQPVMFTDSSFAVMDSIASWQWTFGDGDSAFVPNPVHAYAIDSTYAVTLVVTSYSGCSSTFQDTITFSSPPAADFSFPNNQCAFAPVNFMDLSVPVPGDSVTGWEWTFGDGDTAYVQHPVHSFDSAGIFTVQLVAFSGSGCGDTVSYDITIVPGASASFTLSGTCAGDSVQFTNTSVPAGNTYLWAFGDGDSSMAVDPMHQYPGTGNYSVTLIASTVNGCNDTITAPLQVSQPVSPSFSVAPNTICVGFPAYFFNTSVVAPGDSVISVKWNFGVTALFGDTVSYTFATPGPHTVTLTVTTPTSCDTVATQVITVTQCPPSPCPQASFQLPDTVCAYETVPLVNNTILNEEQQWDFCVGDLKGNPGIATTAPYAGGINGRSMEMVTDGTNWYGFVVNFSADAVQRFDFGNSPFNTPPAPTVLSVSGTTIIDEPLDIKIGRDSANWYAFITNFKNNTDQIVRLKFDSLADDSVTADPINVPAFTDRPIYLALAQDAGSFKLLATYYLDQQVAIFDFGTQLGSIPAIDSFPSPQPAAVVGIDVGRECDEWYGVLTYVNSTIVDKVDFGSSITGNVTTGTLTNVPTNLRQVRLVNEGGDWYAFTIDVNGNDFARISIGPSLSSPFPVLQSFSNFGGQFDKFYGFDMVNHNSRWTVHAQDWTTGELHRIEFPDSCSAVPPATNVINPSVYYTEPGTYYISVAAADGDGNTDFFIDSVHVVEAPDVQFSHTPACLNQAIDFTDLTTMQTGTLQGWTWNFGDSTISSFQHPTHVYSQDTTYSVTLTVTATNGCSSTQQQVLDVREPPVAGFTFTDSLCSETLIPFTDLSLPPPNDTLQAWNWTFGDGTPFDSLSNPLHLFDTAGVFPVQLIVTSGHGCTDTVSMPVTVISSPEADFLVSGTCVGDTVQFQNQTVFGVSNSFTWYFGDNDSAFVQDPLHAYAPVPGDYNVQLIATATNGCADTVVKPVHIGPPASPGFNVSPAILCQGNIVEFTDTSLIPAGETVAQIAWDFGDNTTGLGDTVIHTYQDTGTYVVTMTITTETSCDTSVSALVTVVESPVAAFSVSDVCLDSAMAFNNLSTTPGGTSITTYGWDFGDTGTSSMTSPSYTYQNPDTFNVTLAIVNNQGCYDSTQQQVIVYPNPAASFSVTTAPPCANHPVCLGNGSAISSGMIAGYEWDFGDATPADTAAQPCHTYPNTFPSSSYTITLVPKSEFGCTDTVSQLLAVNNSPEADFSFTGTCFGESTGFGYLNTNPLNPDSAFQWSWEFGDSAVSVVPDPLHTYGSPGSYVTSLVVTALNGCTDSILKTVVLNPTPVAGFVADDTLCFGQTGQFTDTSLISGGAIATWTWQFGDGSGPASGPMVSHSYGSPGSYTTQLVVATDSGCADTTSALILINALPVPAFTLNAQFGAPPLEVITQNNSTGGASWWWHFGDGSSPVPAFSPTHTYNDSGIFVVTLVATSSEGCVDSISRVVELVYPFLDLAVLNASHVIQGNLLQVNAEISNLGSVIANHFEIRAYTDAHTPVNEFWNDSTLHPGEEIPYVFSSRFELEDGRTPGYYCVEILTVNSVTDQVISNNKVCRTLTEGFSFFDIFPNPAWDVIHAGTTFPAAGQIDFCIYNSLGQVVFCERDLVVSKGYNEFTFDVSALSRAVYHCVISSSNGNVLTKKFCKQ